MQLGAHPQALLMAVSGLAACAPSAPPIDVERLTEDVFATERAFAQTMDERDHAAFTTFLADDAVFFQSAGPALRGSAAVAASWSRYFEGDDAPFSWEPDAVEVLDSGTLALSSGPVRDPDGNLIATFNSIWRLDDDRRWRIVFDKGAAACQCR